MENEMNQQSTSRGRNLRPLMLIPVAVLIAKGMSHRRGRRDTAAAGPGFRSGGFGRHGRFGQVDPATGEFRLPPRIEAMLDAWHKRAHDEGEAPEPVTV
jgi:hypothetical protein